MCGFLGITRLLSDEEASRIGNLLAHRGPDGKGLHLTEELSLVHRRLSIIDIPGGNQPIYNEDQTKCIVFNGEMFNYREEREKLESSGHVFTTNSDTEVVLHLVEEYGSHAFSRINGQFSLAVWDITRRRLILARDRFGIKPLYYFSTPQGLIFSSEIKPIIFLLDHRPDLNLEAVRSYFRYRYNDQPQSFFNQVYRFPPGHSAVFDHGTLDFHCYYEVDYEHTPKIKSRPEAVSERVSELLSDAVKLQLVADVEVGLFLSSGIDSAALLDRMSRFKQGVKAYCIGFEDTADETEGASRLARHYGADFHKHTVTSADVDLLPRVVHAFDEPVGDIIIVPTYLLAQFAARDVKVVMSGEGADEVLGGYVHQLLFFYIQKYLRRLPPSLIKAMAAAVDLLPAQALNLVFPYPEKLRDSDKAKIAGIIRNACRYHEARLRMSCLFENDEFAGPAMRTARKAPEAPSDFQTENFFFKEIQEHKGPWLSCYTLAKLDVLTMANSLEGRVPYTDHRLVDYLATLPMDSFISFGQSKLPLRRAMNQSLPRSALWARKRAFYFPYQRMFKGGLSPFVHDMHAQACRDPAMRDLLDLDYFGRLVDSFNPGMSLIDSKRLMAYLIFLLWHANQYG